MKTNTPKSSVPFDQPVRSAGKGPLISLVSCIASVVITMLIIKYDVSCLYWLACITGFIGFTLLMCLPLLMVASGDGYNPYNHNPHFCRRHQYIFDRRSSLWCHYCEAERKNDTEPNADAKYLACWTKMAK